jgi:hypothetical protein
MRFEVPQFIEVEDKIIGPFTWKQFVYLAGGAGAAGMLFFILPFFLFVIFGFPILALAGFLAFHQVNNRPFSEFLESAVNYFAKSRLYLWRKKNPQEVLDKVASPLVVEAPAQAAHLPKPSVNNIASLSRQLELQTLEPKK